MMPNKPHTILPTIKTYYGGKSGDGTYQKIISLIPPHTVYVEGFLGGGAIIRHKKPAEFTIGFELDREIIEEWRKAKKDYYLQLKNRSFLSFTLGDIPTNIQNHEVFIYLDPPYLISTRTANRSIYKYEMTDEQHLELLTFIKTLPYKVAISTYPNEMYATELKDWNVFQFTASKRRGVGTELLYMNYPTPTQLHDYSFIGKDYREREDWKKKRNNFINKFLQMPPIYQNAILEEINQLQHGIKT